MSDKSGQDQKNPKRRHHDGKQYCCFIKKPVVIDDLLTETLRAGARQLLAAAIEAEVSEFLESHALSTK